MPVRIPHTYRTEFGTYYFRYAFSKALVRRFPSLDPQVRFSLQTKSYVEAKKRTTKALYLLQDVVDKLGKIVYTGVSSMKNGFFISPRTLLTVPFANERESFLLSLSNYQKVTKMFDSNYESFSTQNLTARLSLVTCEHSNGSKTLFDYNDPALEMEAAAHYDALRVVLEKKYGQMLESGDLALLNSLGDGVKRMQSLSSSSMSEVTENNVHLSPVSDDPKETDVMDEEASLTFGELVEIYFQEQIDLGYFKEDSTTIRKYRGYMRCITEIIGADMHIADMGSADVQRLRKTVVKYPDRRFVGKKKDVPLAELMADQSIKRISPDTASEYFTRFKTVINFAALERYISDDFAASIQLKVNKHESKQDKRAPFQDEDLKELLAGPIYDATLPTPIAYTPAHFWIPLIAMYSGMRVNEISQLNICDVKTEPTSVHGRVFTSPYFCLVPDHETQNVKTKSSIRLVPVHEKLIEIGFIDYVKQRQKSESDHLNTKLFADVFFQDGSRWGRLVSRWFNGDDDKKGYKNKQLTCSDKKKKTFHSFRHTFVDMLRINHVPDSIIADLVGHKRNTTTSIYGSGHQLPVLKQSLDSVVFSAEVEAAVSALKCSPYNGIKTPLKLVS